MIKINSKVDNQGITQNFYTHSRGSIYSNPHLSSLPNLSQKKLAFISPKQTQNHDENCSDNRDPRQKHEHGHNHHKTAHEYEHVHGANCKYDGHGDAQVKLDKLSFEELIEINSQNQMKNSNIIYKEELKDKYMERTKKQIQFFKRFDEEIREKEQRLNQNISSYEKELKSSRKKVDKKVEDSKSFAITQIPKQLLEVANCIAQCKKLAADHLTDSEGDQYFRRITESYTHVHNILKKFEIEEFDLINTEYNPNTQQSLHQIPTPPPPDYKKSNVAMTMRTGYMIKGRLLRSARFGEFS